MSSNRAKEGGFCRADFLAHEAKNELFVLEATLSAMVNGRLQADPRDLRDALMSARKLTGLMSELLGRGPAGASDTVEDLRALASGIVRTFGSALPSGVRLRFEAPAAPVWVGVPRTQIRSMALNLLTNAAKAVRHQGCITLRISAPGPVPAPEAHNQRAYCVLEVSDDGPGLDPGDVAGLFTCRAPPPPGTLGLGLPSVAHVADSVGARVSCSSSPGEGTTFRVLLPAAPSPGPHGR